MRRLGREILVPTALLTGVVTVALVFLGWESARQSRRLELDADHVRRATALALALTEATHEEARWVSSAAARPGADLAARVAEAGQRLAGLAREVDAFPLSERAAGVWRQFLDARAALGPLGEEVVAAAGRGERIGTALALERWHLVNDRADRLLRDFTGYHLNRLDRTVADLQHRRARSLALAALAVAAGLLLAAGFAVVLVRRVVRPIVEMASAARRVEATGAVSPVAGAERTDEIGVLARAFNQMTDRLVSANSTLAGANATLAEAVRARDEFISIASHELKTPITPLVLRVQQLLRIARDGDAALPREQVVQATRSLESHLLKLTRLIENLLDVSRINSGQLALRVEGFSLAAAIRDAVDRVGDDLAAAGCAIRVDVPPDLALRGDRLRLEQVLVNLLGNAAKYAPGKPVAVRAGAGEDRVEIEIEDGGPGITPADQERIFNRFERASPDRHVGGFGLGFYIAREIVYAHRGELSVRSAPGRGATFTIRLPAEAAPRAGAPDPVRGGGAAAGG